MHVYHNSDACWNVGMKAGTKSKNKKRKSVKKVHKGHRKSKQCVIPSKPRKPASRKKNISSTPTASAPQSLPSPKNKKLSKKNQKFLKGLGLKLKQSVENC